MSKRFDRREFLTQSVAAGTAAWTLGRAQRAAARSPSDKLNLAIVGAGGRGASNWQAVQSENIVALCDVDTKSAAAAFERFPQAARYADFRKLFDAEKSLDGVVISTPDHVHALVAAMALDRGLHVYCEKPLTHTVHEARYLQQKAAAAKVSTQMGNQGHGMSGARQSVEILRSGVLGDVTEVHSWTDRPIWPQGIARPAESQPVPAHLNWDLWLGPAPARPYHECYAPFRWRGWWDFGTGALGDMACHVFDMAYWALDLELPTTVEAESSPVNDETAPSWSVIRYQFPARGPAPPVRFTWYDGKRKPPVELAPGVASLADNGTLIIGSLGTMLVVDPYGVEVKLLPEDRFQGYQPPAPTLPRTEEHHLEWLMACKGGPPTQSHFGYSGRLTEAMLLGNVALRLGRGIEYDAGAGKVKDCPEADRLLRAEYRVGYSLA
ncbi:MAG: Gfo/Idh/MocA family oxidoreductase [Pirellulales bacterium]|nr:Gfo/Idh/MocA family oxidoreductase [Pirellulales bacterium]